MDAVIDAWALDIWLAIASERKNAEIALETTTRPSVIEGKQKSRKFRTIQDRI